jgi:hypothetical protein
MQNTEGPVSSVNPGSVGGLGQTGSLLKLAVAAIARYHRAEAEC